MSTHSDEEFEPQQELHDDFQAFLDSEEVPEVIQAEEGTIGSVIRPRYSIRNMDCYSITESELHQLNFASFGITGLVGVGSATLGFAVNIIVGLILTGSMPNGMQWYTIIAFSLISAVAYLFAYMVRERRRGTIKIIRDESEIIENHGKKSKSHK